MQTDSEKFFLDILKGEKLSSVTFVMDYLQLEFDGNRFTLNVWPVVKVKNVNYKYEEQLYRDNLCSLIEKVVSALTYREAEILILDFENGDSIAISLDRNNPDLNSPEIGVFTNTDEKCFVLE